MGAVVFAIVCTVIRLADRARRRQLWWDDGWAFIAMAASVIGQIVVAFWMAPGVPQSHRVAIFYIVQFAFYIMIWACRASILLTVIRLTSTSSMKTFLRVTLALFALFWFIPSVQILVICTRQPGWEELRPMPACDLGKSVALTGLITQVLSDFVLIFAPIRLILNARMTRSRKTSLALVFLSNVALTVVGFYRSYELYFIGWNPSQTIAATVENAVDLFFANFTVLAAIVLRLRGHDLDRETTHTALPLTTISFENTSTPREVKLPTRNSPGVHHPEIKV